MSYTQTHLSGIRIRNKKMPSALSRHRTASKLYVRSLLVLTCRYLTGDCRKEKQESQEHREKCIHGLKRCRVSVWNSFSPPKSFFPRVSLSPVFYFTLSWVISPPGVVNWASPFSPFSGLSLFASYRLSRTPHFVSRGEGARTTRERERERARRRTGGWRHKVGVDLKNRIKRKLTTRVSLIVLQCILFHSFNLTTFKYLLLITTGVHSQLQSLWISHATALNLF